MAGLAESGRPVDSPGGDVPGAGGSDPDGPGAGGAADGPGAAAGLGSAVLLRQLPLVLAAVLDGRVGLAQARVLCRLVDQIDPAALAEAESNLIAVAAGRDPQALADWVRHPLATWCEPQFDTDMRTQQNKRYLQSWRTADGMLAGRRLSTADAVVFLTVIEPLARPAGLADPRSAAQRRADALIKLCQQVLAFGALPDAGGLRPQVSYVLPADWAAGKGPVGSFADLIGNSLASHILGDLRTAIPIEDSCAIGAWTGPQTRSQIKTILCDARLTRVLLDLRGQVRGLQAVGDTISRTQRRALAARDHGLNNPVHHEDTPCHLASARRRWSLPASHR